MLRTGTRRAARAAVVTAALVTICAPPKTDGSATNSTVHTDNRWAWAGGAECWLNCRPDPTNGAAIGEFFCSGYFWSASVGWIHLGNGHPTNGFRYSNATASDYGVNHDGMGNLRGYAWSDSTGWISFENTGAPKVNLQSGVFGGYAWGGGALGWISFTNVQGFMQTTNFYAGDDSDADGIPDPWEFSKTNSLSALGGPGDPDADGDGASDADEYAAGTNPMNGDSRLEFTAIALSNNNVVLTWDSELTRAYQVESNTNLLRGGWTPTGAIFTVSVSNATKAITPPQSEDNIYYRVRASLPLSQ